MFSRFVTVSRLAQPIKSKPALSRHIKLQNAITKRWSGHNNMEIGPTDWYNRMLKDKFHFYFWLGAIPSTIFLVIVNIRSNPELTEIPDGYEPREWEYYKHPVTRWIARYIFDPMEVEEELQAHDYEIDSEILLMQKIQRRVEMVMSFYNDHRSKFFRPFFGDYYRRGREETEHFSKLHTMDANYVIEQAYDPMKTTVPVEGYKPSHFRPKDD